MEPVTRSVLVGEAAEAPALVLAATPMVVPAAPDPLPPDLGKLPEAEVLEAEPLIPIQAAVQVVLGHPTETLAGQEQEQTVALVDLTPPILEVPEVLHHTTVEAAQLALAAVQWRAEPAVDTEPAVEADKVANVAAAEPAVGVLEAMVALVLLGQLLSVILLHIQMLRLPQDLQVIQIRAAQKLMCGAALVLSHGKVV
jgi:hypothetical protein